MSYRQFVARGPLVPQELFHALEEERLIFFCGAGISVGTGLPTFKGLTDETFSHFGISRREETTCGKKSCVPCDPVLRSVYLRQEYDKALDILEDREGSVGRLRRFIVGRLTRQLAGEEDLALHRALLALARLRPDPLRGERGFHLVTTNFDDRFELAGLAPRWMEAAPRLPRPRRGRLASVVYLHGRIETEDSKRDPDGRTLVLTSADFGDAYLRDGYAARFVLELFREFTVVFIGYGLNDPVMRYLVDALAAETGPEGQFRGAYAFAAYNSTDAAENEAQWKAKHVAPILYDSTLGDSGHQLLRDTLVNWARERAAGFSGRLQVALSPTMQQFVPGRDDGEPMNHLANVSWALSQPDGAIARQFIEAETETDNGPSGPHISWFGPLLASEIRDPRSGRAPGEICRLSDLPEVAAALACWATRNLDRSELIGWLTEARGRPELRVGASFRTAFQHQLASVVSGEHVLEPYLHLWRVMLRILAEE